jgi:hypothetical protein
MSVTAKHMKQIGLILSRLYLSPLVLFLHCRLQLRETLAGIFNTLFDFANTLKVLRKE